MSETKFETRIFFTSEDPTAGEIREALSGLPKDATLSDYFTDEVFVMVFSHKAVNNNTYTHITYPPGVRSVTGTGVNTR